MCIPTREREASEEDLNDLFRYCQMNASLAEVQQSFCWLQSASNRVLNFQGAVGDEGHNSLQLLLMLKVALTLIYQKKNVARCFPMYLFIIHTKYPCNVENVIMHHSDSILNMF